jgi:uncharacterized protein
MEKKGFLYSIHPSGKLFLAVLVPMFCMIVIVFVGLVMLIPFMGSDALKIFGKGMDMTAPENLVMAKYIQVLSHLGLFIVSSMLLAWLFGRNIPWYLYLDVAPRTLVLFLSALLIFACVPFINYVLELNMQMRLPEYLKGVENWMRQSEEMAERVTRSFLRVETIAGLLFNLFVIAVIPAIGEELLFRGVLLRIFRQWTASAHWAVWITAILFSAIHMQFFGFFPRVILGVLFGYLVVWSGSLWPAIIAHFVNNAAAVIFYFLHNNQLADDSFENLGKGTDGLYYALISIVLTFLLMHYIRKLSKPSFLKDP